MPSVDEESIFAAALAEQVPGKRVALLDQACAGDTLLRSRVEALLRAHDNPDSFLEAPLAGSLATVDLTCREGPGTSIGPYRLLGEIGEGGFGIVFLADQQKPMRRRVALKVLKPGMDTRQVIARFEAERQALALMDHPNIAHVIDGGETAGGRPYFVMELVQGTPITDYCDQAQLAPRQRLELFVTVCQAVQHAHQKGIIHRDLKPSNVLVALHDGQPVAKVIDFGIAKATGLQLTEKTLFTGAAQLIGTPLYMSPEQAGPGSLDVDTRSDIYSLGVLLYELLTGTTPLAKERLKEASYDELCRLIREEEPARPSARLSALGAAAEAVSANPQSDPRRLAQLCRGDLDWIVLKALEKDRSRRYETASALAADVERYLNDEPVEACPPSALYRLRKLVRRNRAAVVAASVVFAGLLLGAAVSTWQAVRATLAESDAKAGWADAEQKGSEAKAGWATAQQRESDAEKARHKAEQARTRAEKARAEAKRAAAKAKRAAAEAKKRGEEVRQNLYIAEMNLAGQAAALPGGIARVNELLQAWRPKGKEPDRRGWEWYYLYGLGHRSLLTMRGHTDLVQRVLAWGPDGLLASTNPDGTIKIRDATTGRDKLTLHGHTGWVWSAAWDPRGKRLASAGDDGTVKLWDACTGREVRTLRGHSAEVLSVSWSPEGTRLASASGDKTIKVWDAATGKAILTLHGHSRAVMSVAWSPDGKHLASTDINQAKVWEAATGKECSSRGFQALSVAWSPDGARLAGGDSGGTVRVWDAAGGKEPVLLRASTDWVRSVAWSPDGTRLASASDDRAIKVWDVKSGQERLRLRGHTGPVDWVAWSRDGRRLASASWDGTIKVWDAATEPEMVTHQLHAPGGWTWAWNRDGKRLASGGGDGTITLWNVASGKKKLTWRGHTRGVQTLAWSPDETRLASGSLDQTVKVWDTATGKETVTLRGHPRHVYSVAWSPDGTRLASADIDQIRVWDPAAGKDLLTIPHDNIWTTSVAWSPDGKWLASIGDGGPGKGGKAVTVWDPASGKEMLTLRGHASLVTVVSWSPDGARLASACWDGAIKVWDPAARKALLTLQGHTSRVPVLAWSPDGTRLVSGGADHAVKIWEAASGKEVLSLPGHSMDVSFVAWSRDGLRLASAGNDGTIHIHDATIGHAVERSAATAAARGKRALARGKLDEATAAPPR
jgi:WD40 repeat protein/serine/threonine protein kinase